MRKRPQSKSLCACKGFCMKVLATLFFEGRRRASLYDDGSRSEAARKSAKSLALAQGFDLDSEMLASKMGG